MGYPIAQEAQAEACAYKPAPTSLRLRGSPGGVNEAAAMEVGMRWWIGMMVCVCLAGCVTLPPSAHRFKGARTFDASYEEVWSAAIGLFSENGWESERMEKNAGIIVSEWIKDEADGGDYGQRGMSASIEEGSEQVALNIRVIRESDTATRVRVHCFFRVRWSEGKNKMWGNGTSRGVWEARILKGIERAL